jgi:restriction system protein
VLQWTERGRDFAANPRGEAVRLIDEREGILKLLSLFADRGQAQTTDIWEPWRAFLDAESNVRSDSYARSVLYRRIRNLLDRGLLSKSGRVTSITEDGLAWLRAAGTQADTSGSEEEQDIQALAQQQRARVRGALLETIREMDPIAFEHLVASLLDAMGYDNVQVTAPSNDKGVDVVANIKLGISSVREVIQVKRQKANIGRPVLDALRGSLHRFQAVRGTIISTGGFSKGTMKAAFEPGAAPITLMDGETLVDSLMAHSIGVRKREIVLWELDPSGLAAKSENEPEDE